MKSVLISIRPKWCELIANGKKTIEVRKTKPKCDTPFKCYIYCTKNGKLNAESQMVIGEFVCDTIIPISIYYSDQNSPVAQNVFPFTCLTDKQMIDYLGNGKSGYGWHISDLKMYDKPRYLDEFYHNCGDNPKCGGCEALYFNNTDFGKDKYCCFTVDGCRPHKRPPQSWCYVETEVDVNATLPERM